MARLLYSLPVRGVRDLLLLRQRTRQIAGLLGFDLPAQGRIAAQTFALACPANRARARCTVAFALSRSMLIVRVTAPRGPQTLAYGAGQATAFALPSAGPRLAGEDIGWAMRQLANITPLDALGELQRLNADVLGTSIASTTAVA
jgi:hypothetical protein